MSASFSPDGAWIVTAGDDGTARVWDAATGVELRRLAGHGREAPSASFSPDSRLVVTAGDDGTARVWDAVTGAELLRFGGDNLELQSASFSPDGRLVITGGFDGTARIWSAETGEELASLISFTNGTWAVTDPEGRYDASNGGDIDGLVWVLDTPDGAERVPLAEVQARYYDPGLLAKRLGLSDVPLRDVGAPR